MINLPNQNYNIHIRITYVNKKKIEKEHKKVGGQVPLAPPPVPLSLSLPNTEKSTEFFQESSMIVLRTVFKLD